MTIHREFKQLEATVNEQGKEITKLKEQLLVLQKDIDTLKGPVKNTAAAKTAGKLLGGKS